MHTPSQMRRRPATAANAPREAATNAIVGPASPHVAASTSLAMLRIVPPPRIGGQQKFQVGITMESKIGPEKIWPPEAAEENFVLCATAV